MLQGIKGAKVFQDDILIFAANKELHDNHIHVVLSALRQHGLTVSSKKMHLWPRGSGILRARYFQEWYST